jgi:hypothetical protein
MTLTRATLGKLTKRATKDMEICGQSVRMQRPTPLEFSQYQTSLVDNEGKAVLSKFADAIALLVARMWIDDEGTRLFRDNEIKELTAIDLGFYQTLSEECQKFSRGKESVALGESGLTIASDSPVESVLNSE